METTVTAAEVMAAATAGLVAALRVAVPVAPAVGAQVVAVGSRTNNFTATGNLTSPEEFSSYSGLFIGESVRPTSAAHMKLLRRMKICPTKLR